MTEPIFTAHVLEKLILWCFDTTHAHPSNIVATIAEHSTIPVFFLGIGQCLVLPTPDQEVPYGINFLRWHFRQLSREEALPLLIRFQENHPTQVPAIIAWASPSP